ncbi:MAG: tRNA uridine-5-carboxymethylaminomethyl(34) synthesis GTPase MnmE [Proteobacteria bacterium]|nr:tRNA uridine-5-carboxymethylaminomethyl(34) synthesis GTPase MnmE [Pseudomonadota bacterium]
MTDTIFALSSGHGRAGIAVIRVSGPSLQSLFEKIVKYGESRLPPVGGESVSAHEVRQTGGGASSFNSAFDGHARNCTVRAQSFAKALRRTMTKHEAILWKNLRKSPAGFDFVKQFPIGKYIADFANRKTKLIVELDGIGHSEEKQIYHDAERDRFLQDSGYRIIRFWNESVIKNMNGVLDAICYYLTHEKEVPPLRNFYPKGIINLKKPPLGGYAATPPLRGGDAPSLNFPILSRHAYLADLVTPKQSEGGLVAATTHDSRFTTRDEIIDRAIAIYFSAPNSFTGEDVIEFHTHGSPAVIEKLFQTLESLGARLAEPGEFTRRAFDNGKMDLVEVDGLAALLASRTDAQRRAALRSAAGADSAIYENWRLQMIEIAAYAAAILDYPSDELPANIEKTLIARTQKLHDEISTALSRAGAARAVRSGFNIALVGDVNVGKSSLFNRLIGESRAIVSEIPGTTRDVVSAEIDIDGYLVRLSDTAGLRDTTDAIEKIGIAKTNAEIENADLVIRVFPSCGGVDSPQSGEDGVVYPSTKENEIIVFNKCDLNKKPPRSLRDHPSIGGEYRVSAMTGAGISELLDTIKRRVHKMLDGAESDVVVNARAKELLNVAADELKQSLDVGARRDAPDKRAAHEPPLQMDLFAEHIRAAADAIGRILGLIGVDEVADAVFGQLCLGK